MRRLCCAALLFLAVVGLSNPAYSMVIADSVADFSAVQGQDNWFYGFVNRGAQAGSSGYAVTDFVEFANFDTTRWEASDAQVGANNNPFLSIDPLGGHPTGLGPDTQDSIIWATRRYVSDFDGLVDIAFDLRKENIVNPGGGGITGADFH